MEINIDKIMEYIVLNGLTKTQFAKECKISYSTLNKILNNNKRVNLKGILKISITMGISIQDMFVDKINFYSK